MEILSNYALEIFFGLVSAGALAFCRSVFKKNKELEGFANKAKEKTRKNLCMDFNFGYIAVCWHNFLHNYRLWYWHANN